MNPKDIVYKMVVLGRRLTTHFILDIFWGSSFMWYLVPGLSRQIYREDTFHVKKTPGHMFHELLYVQEVGLIFCRAREKRPGHRGNAIIRKVKPVSLGQQVRRG